jgi:hypothetical protein
MIYAKSWADSIYAYAGGRPVVFSDAYSFPSLYKYYHPDAITMGYNTVNYRKTQFDIHSEEALLNNKKVYAASPYKPVTENVVVSSQYNTMYLQTIDSFKAVHSLKIKWLHSKTEGAINANSNTIVLLENSGNDTIMTKGLFVNYTFLKTRNERFSPPAMIAIEEKYFPAHYKKNIFFSMQWPKEPGRYHLIFSIVQPPFGGNFASSFYTVVVE